MKKIAAISLAVFGLSVGAFAQGSINLDDSSISPGVAVDTAGNYYTGTYGIQVYILNTTTLPGNINNLDGVNSSQAYANMLADGYTLQGSFTGKTMSNPGVFSLGELDMAGVSPAGSSVSIALVAWTGSGTSFPTSAPGKGGVISFVNPTANYTIPPPNTPTPPFLTGWNSEGQDLIMTTVPEPTTFALAGLGAAALMVFRRRK